jgi:hypothetical protein
VQLIGAPRHITCKIRNVLKEKKQKPEECLVKGLIAVMHPVIVIPQALFIKRRIAMMILIIWSLLRSPQVVLLVANNGQAQVIQILVMSRLALRALPQNSSHNKHHSHSSRPHRLPHSQ